MDNLKILAKKTLEAENYEEAKSHVQKILEKDLKDPDAWFLKAKISLESSTYDLLKISEIPIIKRTVNEEKIDTKEIILSLKESIQIDDSKENIIKIQKYLFDHISYMYDKFAKHLQDAESVYQNDMDIFFLFCKSAAELIEYSSSLNNYYDKSLKLGIELINDANRTYTISMGKYTLKKEYQLQLNVIKNILTEKVKNVESDFIIQNPKGNVRLGGGSSCFVVTAITGSSDNPIVNEFRLYRSNVLHQSSIGRSLSNLYEIFGPYLARLIRNNSFLKRISKTLIIKPIYWLLLKTKK
ncbi:MAG: CFI-box-CTERM domain-containing protein [Balneolaceae bacterium]